MDKEKKKKIFTYILKASKILFFLKKRKKIKIFTYILKASKILVFLIFIWTAAVMFEIGASRHDVIDLLYAAALFMIFNKLESMSGSW